MYKYTRSWHSFGTPTNRPFYYKRFTNMKFSSKVPTSNYIGWLIIGLFTQSIYNLQFRQKEIGVSVNLYLAFFFFLAFLI